MMNLQTCMGDSSSSGPWKKRAIRGENMSEIIHAGQLISIAAISTQLWKAQASMDEEEE